MTDEAAGRSTERIPPELRNRSKASGGDAGAAKIIAAGASVAAGVGLVGTMAALAVQPAGAAPAATPATTRVVIVQQPVLVGDGDPLSLPDRADLAPAAIVIETQPQPAPVTKSGGS